MPLLESPILSVMRDVLCGSMSLEDGLSALQTLGRTHPSEVDLAFEIARAIEEVILRRPVLASAKLTELMVRHSFSENRSLPLLLMLMETRYTNSFRRNEAELLPDKEALPRLLDILGELAQSVGVALELNLRPLLPFLADETLLTLDAIYARGHRPSIRLSLREAHYLASLLIDQGLSECAEALLHRVLHLSRDVEMYDLAYEVLLDEAYVLTELGLYDDCRALLAPAIEEAERTKNLERLASLTLCLVVNETRDDAVDHVRARTMGDRAVSLFAEAVSQSLLPRTELAMAYLVIGSSILGTGWREGVREAIERFESALHVLDDIQDGEITVSMMLFKCFAGLGFAHALSGGYENTELAIDHLNRALAILRQLERNGEDLRAERARCHHAIGWAALLSESDEFWERGISAFREATRLRKVLQEERRIPPIETLGSQLGLTLSELRTVESIDDSMYTSLRDVLLQYVPLFPTDSRSYVEVAIAVYDVAWTIHRHGLEISPRILRLFDDIVRMLDESKVVEGRSFVAGAQLVVPCLAREWNQLERLASVVAAEEESLDVGLRSVARLMGALAVAKMNIEGLDSLGPEEVRDPVSPEVQEADPLLAGYWAAQAAIIRCVSTFRADGSLENFASGLEQAAQLCDRIPSDPAGYELSEFVRATSASLGSVLYQFASVLKSRLSDQDVRITDHTRTESLGTSEPVSMILSEDWLGLIKITSAYLQMIERDPDLDLEPYLRAIQSNLLRAVRVMDRTAMIERRLLSRLGLEMNRRYYMRR